MTRKIVKSGKDEYPVLTGIWERSVRATHHFLHESDIQEIKQALEPEYFPSVDLYAASDNGHLCGFIGLAGGKIEMLFVDNAMRGRGYGSMLMDLAIQRGATEVDVNEQNQAALRFYTSRGFRLVSRDATDDAGRPYPILHLSL